ncbi:MAG: hypothetical protein ACD_79C01058G0003 [uncultured bacterium]|nr:MAG: hypothetical protein ACD_79C01058G0003 [uncultured bacterium]
MLENYDTLSMEEKRKLLPYVTNTDKSVFALRNLPEVIKGALFSRYSRSALGLRQLLLKEFIGSDEASFSDIAQGSGNIANQEIAIKKAEEFYNRVLDGYGDDSIGELGGAHLAFENVSIIATKIIEDARIGGSPLEKSTRYIFFDQKVDNDYRFLKEPVLMQSKFKDLYLSTCRNLFEVYSECIEPLTKYVEKITLLEEGVSVQAYKASVRARVCDALRGLLPASTLTNIGMFGNGRFFETLIQKLNCSHLSEMKEIGTLAFEELSKIIPSFVRRGNTEHKHFKLLLDFLNNQENLIKNKAQNLNFKKGSVNNPVSVIDYDKDAIIKVASAILYEYTDAPLKEIYKKLKNSSKEELDDILKTCYEGRLNRRHKPPRALEHAFYTFDLVGDYGIFRDLHRHRMLTQQRQLLSTNLGYNIPQDIIDSGLDKKFTKALNEASKAYDIISKEYPLQAQYVVPMAYRIRWYFKINLRSLVWMCELRSAPQGHINYRKIAQEITRQVCKIHPEFSPFFKFVNFEEIALGRLEQEKKSIEKRNQRN